MAQSETTKAKLKQQVAAIKKIGGKELRDERAPWNSETCWIFRGIFVGAKEIVTHERGTSWNTGRLSVYVKADIGKPSRFGGRATVSRQYCSKDPEQNARKAIATAEDFAATLAEMNKIDAVGDTRFKANVARVKELLDDDPPDWVRLEASASKAYVRFRLGTREVTPEQACAIIRILEDD